MPRPARDRRVTRSAALVALVPGAVLLPAPAQAVDYPGGRRSNSTANTGYFAVHFHVNV